MDTHSLNKNHFQFRRAVLPRDWRQKKLVFTEKSHLAELNCPVADASILPERPLNIMTDIGRVVWAGPGFWGPTFPHCCEINVLSFLYHPD